MCLLASSCVYTVFDRDSGPTGNNKSVVEDRNPLIRPPAAPVPCYYKSHVSSKCITLQQESLQRLIHISGTCTWTIPLYYAQKYGWIISITLHLWTVLPENSASLPSPLILPLSSSSSSVAVKAVDWSWQRVSAFNFLHHLTTHFYVTVFF